MISFSIYFEVAGWKQHPSLIVGQDTGFTDEQGLLQERPR